jgi:hypothetical protein
LIVIIVRGVTATTPDGFGSFFWRRRWKRIEMDSSAIARLQTAEKKNAADSRVGGISSWF